MVETVRINRNTLIITGLAVVFVVGILAGALLFNTGPTGSATNTEIPVLKLSVDDDFVFGDENADVLIIEFSDFQCPYCRKFWKETLPQLETEYVDTGKVRFAYRDFPLEFHPSSQKAAEAAECAREQGMWREMHDMLFSEQDKQGQGTIEFTVDDIKSWATNINGLDSLKFNSCLDSNKYEDEVKNDFIDGTNVGVSGTPTFLIVSKSGRISDSERQQLEQLQVGYATDENGNDVLAIVGAYPFAAFKAAIDASLS